MKTIKETTKEERQQIIHDMFRCHNGDCDNCGICMIFKGTSPVKVYQDYIDGKREFQDIAREFNQRK